MASMKLGTVLDGYLRSDIDAKWTAEKLWEGHVKSRTSAFPDRLWEVCEALLKAPKDSGWEKASVFLKILGTSLAGKSEAFADECSNIIEHTVERLLLYTSAEDSTYRLRALVCIDQLLQGLLDLGVTQQLTDAMVDHLSARLNDSIMLVRQAAIKAVSNLSELNEQGFVSEHDPVTASLVQRLSEEDKPAVRAVILEALALNTTTLPVIVDCTRDEAEEVRRIAYNRLAQLSTNIHEPDEYRQLLMHGLNDSSTTVRAAAASMLTNWLEYIKEEDKIHALLDKLDVQRHPDLCMKAIDSLISSQHIDVSQLLKLVPGGGMRPGPDGAIHLTNAQAFTRWYVVSCLSSGAKAASATAAATTGAAAAAVAAGGRQLLDELDGALPEDAHQGVAAVQQVLRSGPGHRAAAMYLIYILTTSMDFADGPSRDCGLTLLKELLLVDPRADARHGLPPPVALLSHGGTGTWEAAVIGLSQALLPQPTDCLTAIADVLTKDAAPAWGIDLQGRGLKEENDDQAARSCWLQLLAYTSAALKAGPRFTAADLGLGDVSCSMKLLIQAVVLPGLTHHDRSIRTAALKATHHLALTPAASAALPRLCAAAYQVLRDDSDHSSQAAAAKMLLDIMLVYGTPHAKTLVWEGHVMPACGSRDADVDDLADQLNTTGLHGSHGQRNAPTVVAGSPDQGASPDLVKGMIDLLHESLGTPPPKDTAKKRKPAKSGEVSGVWSHVRVDLLGVSVQGLCRLVRYQDTVSQLSQRMKTHTMAMTPDEEQSILVSLLSCLVHPSLSQAPGAQQCLVQFLQAYVPRHGSKARLVSALRPALRQALSLTPPDGPATSTCAPALLTKVATLLLATTIAAAKTSTKTSNSSGSAKKKPTSSRAKRSDEEDSQATRPEGGDGDDDDDPTQHDTARSTDQGGVGDEAEGKLPGCPLTWLEMLALSLCMELQSILQPKHADIPGRDEYIKTLVGVLRTIPLTPEGHPEVVRACDRLLSQCLKSKALPGARSVALRTLKEASTWLQCMALDAAAVVVPQQDVAAVMEQAQKVLAQFQGTQGSKKQCDSDSEEGQDIDEDDEDNEDDSNDMDDDDDDYGV